MDEPPGTDRTVDCGGPAQDLLAFARVAEGASIAGRYRINARLGAGGTGEVFSAFDTFAGTHVALKILYPRGHDPDETDLRLQRELAAARRITHDGVVRVYDVGRAEGLQFLVMELLEGETLRARLLRERRLAASDAARIMHGILSALAAVHEAGTTHRDIKPANVFLRRLPDGSERIVLLDLGLARSVGDVVRTSTGEFSGTLEYVSPEQARGDRDVGPPSDLYGAGIVVWEMLAGSPPFTASSLAELILAHLGRTLPKTVPSSDGDTACLQDLATWLLEKEPEARPASARAALAFLARGRRRSLLRRWRAAWVRRPRRRGLLAAGAVIALAIVAAGLFVPVSVRFDSREIETVSVFGRAIHRVTLRGPVGGCVALDAGAWWPRYRLVWQTGHGAYTSWTPDAPNGLLRLDMLTGAMSPLPFRGHDGTPIEPLPFWPGYDQVYFISSMKALATRTHAGRSLFAIDYTHVGGPPSCVVVINDLGVVVGAYPHDGFIRETTVELPPREATDPMRLAFVAHNTGLRRLSVFAVTVPLLDTFPDIVSLPPFELDRRTTTRRPLFYVFLPRVNSTASLCLRQGAIEVRHPDGNVIPLDASTGAPLNAEHRDGATISEWTAHQAGLLKALEVGAGFDLDGRHEAAAAVLEAYGREAGVTRVQRSVALERAALFLQRGGFVARALDLAREVAKLEPDEVGHVETLIELLSRCGRWREARDLALARPTLDANTYTILVRAGLVAGETDEVERLLVRAPSASRMKEIVFTDRVRYALITGRVDEILAAPEWKDVSLAEPRNAALAAFAEVLRERPDAARLLSLVDLLETRRAGNYPPVVPLRALVAALSGTPGPSRDAIEASLAEHHRLGLEEMRFRFVELWAEAITARALKLRGDMEGFETHRRAARAITPRAPFLALLLDRPSR